MSPKQKVVNKRGYVRVTFELSPQLKRQLVEQARRRDMTVARFVRGAVRRFLNQSLPNEDVVMGEPSPKLTAAIVPPPYATRKALRDATLAVGRQEGARRP